MDNNRKDDLKAVIEKTNIVCDDLAEFVKENHIMERLGEEEAFAELERRIFGYGVSNAYVVWSSNGRSDRCYPIELGDYDIIISISASWSDEPNGFQGIYSVELIGIQKYGVLCCEKEMLKAGLKYGYYTSFFSNLPEELGSPKKMTSESYALQIVRPEEKEMEKIK